MNARLYRKLGHSVVAGTFAIGIAYVAQVNLLRSGNVWGGLLTLSLAGGLIVYAVRLMGDVPDSGWSRRRVLGVMSACILSGAAMRFWDLASIPEGVWFDEAQNGLVATRILTDATFRPIYISDLTQLPALFFYYLAAWIGLLGPNILAVRLASATLGLLTIPGIFLLGRELFGQRVGVTSAVLLSLSRWHVNFSRFGMNGIATPFFTVYSLYFLARGLRTREPVAFALAGLSLGLGLNTYLAFAVVPMLVGFWIGHLTLVGRLPFLRTRGPLIALAMLTAVLVVLPLGIFAVNHQEEFFQRMRTTSLFTGKTAEQAREALVSNLIKHAEMFNIRGDNNGRHNLAGAPELDDGTAALFVLGIIVSIAKARQPRFMLLLLWLSLLLSPAILSLDFESPQSYRGIGVIPATSLLASIPVAYVWGALGNWIGRVWARIPDLMLATVLIGISYANAHVYWFQQVWDPATWPAFSTQETLIAREINRLGPGYRVLMDPIFLNTPTIRFLAPELRDGQSLIPAKDLPFHDAQNTVIFASDLNASWMDVVRRDYPTAVFKIFPPAPRSPPILYEAIVSREQAQAVQGVVGIYTVSPAGGNQATVIREDRTINANWATSTPFVLPFSVNWKTTLTAPTYGTYLFKLEGPPAAELSLDEVPLMRGGEQVSIKLAQGTHRLGVKVSLTEPRDIRLLWQPPGGLLTTIPSTQMFVPPVVSRGLLARYYPNADWAGPPVLEQVDPVVSTYFHLLPLPQPFTIEWIGKIDVPVNGIYRFGTQSIDSSWLFIDDQLIVNNSGQPDRYVEGAVNLTDGLHDMRIRFLDRSGHSFVRAYWQPPGQPREVLPVARLFPPQGAYPERAGPLQPSPLAPLTTPDLTPAPVPPRGPARAPGALPISPLTVRMTIGKPGNDPTGLVDPRAVGVDSLGNVFVVNTGRQRVDEYNAAGEFLRSFGGTEAGEGRLSEPVDAVVSERGELLVLDATEGWIVRFAPNGAYLGKFGGPDVGFYHPRSLARDASGNLYVADTGTGHLDVFDADGHLRQKIELKGESQTGLPQPVGVAIGPDGTIYVTDAARHVLTQYDASVQVIRTWELSPFNSVEGAHLLGAPDGSIYLSDPPGHRVIRLDRQGTFVDQLGGAGQLDQPVGLALGPDGNVYVADTSGKVVVFGTR